MEILPEDLIIYIHKDFLHPMYMYEVKKELEYIFWFFPKFLSYISNKKTITNRKKIFGNKKISGYLINKIYKYLHYRMFKKCMISLVKPSQHLIFDD